MCGYSLQVIHVTSDDRCRHSKQQHKLYEDEEEVEVLGQTDTVAFSADDWTSLSNHMTLGGSLHIILAYSGNSGRVL